MRRRWIRNEPERRDELIAAGVALGAAAAVAAVAFYFTRILVAREEVTPLDVARSEAALPEKTPRGGGGA